MNFKCNGWSSTDADMVARGGGILEGDASSLRRRKSRDQKTGQLVKMNVVKSS